MTSCEGAAARSGTGGTLPSGAGVKSRTAAAGERKFAAHGRAFETGDRAQRFLSPLRETRPRRFVGITRLRKT